jgi:protein phosphatase
MSSRGISVGLGNTLQYHVRSHVGRRRSNNQDAAVAVPAKSSTAFKKHGWLFIIADGMGAHAGGEEASRIAVTRIPEIYSDLKPESSPPLALSLSLSQANKEIHSKGENDPGYKGMGTTCSAMVVLPQGVILGHVGDSRIYRIRENKIEQLSRDHSLAWEVAAASGQNELKEGANLPSVPKNIITRSMGPHDDLDPDLEGPFPIEPNDLFVLCSDGLSGTVRDEEIAIFASELSLKDATAALVGLALVRGAPDNTTMILVKAGPQEVTQYSKRETPWPLEDDGGNRANHRRPWIFLGMAAISFFLGMASFSASKSFVKDEFLQRIFFAASIIMAGLSLGSVFGSFFSFTLIKPRRKIKMITPGRGTFLGRSPYRHYDSTPSEKLFNSLIRSLHHAQAELAENNLTEESQKLTESIQNAKHAVQSGNFSLATQAVFNGIRTFSDTFNATRFKKPDPNGSA